PCDASPRRPRSHPRERDLRLPRGMARADRMHPDDLGPLFRHRDRGLDPAPEPAGGLAGGQPALHPARDPVAPLLSDLHPPARLGRVARLLPATYAALLVQGALGLGGPANLAVDGGLLVLSTALRLAAASGLYEWREP